MDTTTQWPQGIVVKPIEETVTINTCPNSNNDNDFERNSNKLARSKESVALNCPRCNSTNTKFCYYNNYSLTQPRHFCKSCRRYWTNGGSLRSIPVGGASRKKNKRSSSSSSSNLSNKSIRLPDLIQPQRQDLELGFPSNQVFTPHHQEKNHSLSTSTTTSASRSHLSAMELLNGFTSRGLSSSFNNGGVYTPLFPMSDLMVKPTLNFSLDVIGSGCENGDLQGQENSGLLFPFENLKNNNKDGDSSNGYWSGMLGGGTW